MKLTTKQKGILLMLASALMFSAMQIVVRLTGDRIPLMEQVFFRSTVCTAMCLVILRRNKIPFFGERKAQPLLFLRSGFGTLGIISLFYASARANQADVTILSKLSPFLITLFAFLFLKEKIAKIQIPALLIAFCGALFVVRPGFHSNTLPLFMAFLNSILSGITYTLLAYSKDKVNVFTIIMHFSAFSALTAIPFFITHIAVPEPRVLLLLLLMGTFGGFGQIALTYAYRMAPASEVSIYNYSGILFSMILAYFVLGETVAHTSLLGGALVILASLLTYRYSGSSPLGQQEE